MLEEEGKDIDPTDGKLRRNIEARLQFIEFRLFWEGHINRGDLCKQFGVSVPQASADLSRYQDSAPGNLIYDKSAKSYVAGNEFRPVFIQPSADAYLASLRLHSLGILPDEQSWILNRPAFAVMPILRRKLDPSTLRAILRAIRNRLSLHVLYQTISQPEPKWRWISPHALGFDGSRWHCRSWCHEKADFRDFLFARILEIREERPSIACPENDHAWHQEVVLRIVPHERITGGAREAIELDFGMVNGVLEIRTRKCMAPYFERSLGLDLNPDHLPPARQQIVLLSKHDAQTNPPG
ncbi:MAG: helix-turn-helix transcriptional regulator [Planctomyces sp.]|jgi:hypothetical protein